MRVLICGLIGAAASAAVWLGLEHNMQKDFGWLAILVGLVTGWSIHTAAGANAGVGYVRGALAVVLSLAAIVGGQKVYAKWMEASNVTAASVVKAAVATIDDKDADAEAADVIAEAPAVELKREELHVGGAGAKKMPIKQIMSEMDFVWMGVAALAAYVVGKGRDPVPAMDQPVEPTPEPEENAG